MLYLAATTTVGSNGNLPLPLDAFLGREAEVGEIRRALASHRLLTLTGPAGCGKSRLAVEAAAALREGFPDGVRLVRLDALEEPRLLVQAVVAATGIREEAGREPLETLVQALGERRALLVMDDCEHLLPACGALVRRLLETGPGPKVLATSREPLRVPGERVQRIQPLELPPVGAPAEELVRNPCVALFLDRALARGADLDPTADAAAVAEVCRRLDGLPLAIELAAAQSAVLPLAALLALLDANLEVLRAARGGRHASLRAALDASYGRLTRAERATFLRLSSFAGSFGLEAVREVCAGDGVREEEAVAALVALVDRSLVIGPLAPREPRYRLLAPVQRFARDRAREGGEAERADRAHLRFFTLLAERAAAGLEGPEQRRWLDVLAADEENLRAALGRAVAARERAGQGLRLAAALGRFWAMTGLWSEGRDHLERLLELAAPRNPARGPAVLWAAALALLQGSFERAAELAHRCVRAAGRSRPELAAEAAAIAAVARANLGDPGAELEAEAAVERLRELGARGALGRALMGAGVVARLAGRHERAIETLREGVGILRANGDHYFVAHCLSNLGLALVARGALPEAEALFQEALEARRTLRDRQGIGWSLKDLGDVALARGQLLTARARYLESRAALEEVGDRAALEAVEAALARIEGERRGPGRRARQPGGTGPDALTPREREVVELLARGATNREIGRALFITEGTAALHVQHVLAKLGFRSRTQVAAWAVLHGLAPGPSGAGDGRPPERPRR